MATAELTGAARVKAKATLAEARHRLVAAQAEGKEMANAVRRGALVPVDAVKQDWARHIGLPTLAKGRLPHLSVSDVLALDGLVREALEELAAADHGKPSAAARVLHDSPVGRRHSLGRSGRPAHAHPALVDSLGSASLSEPTRDRLLTASAELLVSPRLPWPPGGRFPAPPHRARPAAAALAGPALSALHSGHVDDAPAGVTRARSGVQETCFAPPTFSTSASATRRRRSRPSKPPPTSRRSALRVDPKNLSALMLSGVLFEGKGDIPNAQQAYEKVLTLNPRFTPAANNLAWLYTEHRGDQDRALQLAQTAREVAPEDPHMADTLGWILYKRGVYQRALGLLKESVAKLGDNPVVQYHLGMAAFKAGDKETARQALGRAVAALADFPGKDEAKRTLGELK